MLSQDIESCAASIDVLAGQVSEEQRAFLRMLQENLRAHAAQARHLNRNCCRPQGPGHCRASMCMTCLTPTISPVKQGETTWNRTPSPTAIGKTRAAA